MGLFNSLPTRQHGNIKPSEGFSYRVRFKFKQDLSARKASVGAVNISIGCVCRTLPAHFATDNKFTSAGKAIGMMKYLGTGGKAGWRQCWEDYLANAVGENVTDSVATSVTLSE